MNIKEKTTPAFLNGGGELGERMRLKDWSATPVGEPENWPHTLRTSVNIMLNSQFPMFVWWGKELITFYNDPYRSVAGEKHPDLLGKPGQEAWGEIWHDLEPLVASVFQGTSTWAEDQLLMMNRHGYLEETYFTFSYSPLFDDTGVVAGLFCACIETTEKVFAERKIRESERNLRGTILQAPVAMCIFKEPSFVVEIANERMFELWGRSSKEMLNKPLFEGLPEVKEQGIEEILMQVYTTGETFVENERPVTLPRNEKTETIYVSFVYEPFREGDGSVSGIIAVAIDVTQQVIARKKIEESEQELHLRVKKRTEELEKQNHFVDSILTNSSNGISVTEMIRDEKGAVIDAKTIIANDAAVQNIGLPKEEYLTKTSVELDPNIFQSDYGKNCITTLKTGKPFLTQYFFEHTKRWLELTVSKMDDEHLIHIFTDVTSIKEAQLQLEKTVEELRRSNVNLEQFSYAASHDLKEPIRKINVFSERLRQELSDKLNDTQKRLFERMSSATQRMTILIDDLLEYSHTTKGVVNVEAIDLNVKVERVLDDLDLQVQEKAAKISVGALPVVNGNRRQMQQLFQNLITNALKYSKKGEVPVIDISSTTVKGKDVNVNITGLKADQEYYLIQVKDNGIGFEPEYEERIFNIFTRLHGTSEYPGSGVGLSIVRRVLDNHRGFIWAKSKPGEGAVFSVLLPAE